MSTLPFVQSHADIPQRHAILRQFPRLIEVAFGLPRRDKREGVEANETETAIVSTLCGYARVSSTSQDLTVQREALAAAGCNLIREEKRSGTTAEGRDELKTLLAFIRKGGTLVVTRIDRLARSIGDLQVMMGELKAKGAALRCTEQLVDTTTAAGKAFLDMLGVFAEFETNLRRERQMEGIAAAKRAGVYKGRKPSLDVAEIRRLKGEGVGASEIAKRLGSAVRVSIGCLRVALRRRPSSPHQRRP